MAKRSKTANRLKPFIVEMIGNTRARGAVSAGGSGGGGAGVSDHGALTGLGDDDHAQYLLASGGRALSGNMSVSNGVTIDGVDISAHRDDPDAHHDRVTVSDPLAVADQALSLTLGNGVETSAAALRVKLPTNSGLTRDTTGIYLAPSTLTVSTSNGVSGSGHTHGITASADVGTTPAEALLKSNGSGALTLGSLTTKGSIDVLNGGDLTVAGSGAYAGTNVLFVDSSGGNVGIMGAPDPQFALDIVGPARASYWIGPHAIQLKDVLFLSHYDGRFPIETNFSGEPNGHMGQVATLNGNVVYKAGKFGKAVQLARGTTNLVTNPRPNPAGGTTGWNYFAGTAPTNATITTTLPAGFVGVRAIYYAGLQFGWPNTISVTNTGSYQYSGWILASANCTMSFYIQQEGGAYGTISNAPTLALTANTWAQFDVTLTATATATGRFVFTTSGAPNVTIANVQIETGAGATPYHDGDMLTPASWTGTAHASTSTRSASYITYPTAGNINANAWTCMAWVYLHSVGDTQTVWRINGSTSGYIWLRITSAALAEGLHGSAPTVLSSSTLAKKTWYHIVVTYDGTTIKMYVNGTEEDSDTGGTFSGMPTSMAVGGAPGGAEYLNGLIDDLVILSRAMPAGEVLSVYESNAPVFAETARFSFRATPQGLVWADDEGLWMRDATGGPVLGAYGGEAASKSWASLTLAPGDVVLGDGASSYLLWDDSAGTLKLNTASGADTAYMLLSGFYLDMYANGVRRFRFDADLGQVTIGQVAASKANVYVTDNLVSLSVYTTDKVVLSATGGSGSSGYILVGETSSTSKNNVYIDADGLKFRQGTSITNLSVSTAGVITVGEVDTGKSNVLISSGAVKLRNNTTDVITLLASPGTQNTLAKFDGSVEVAANVFAGSYNVRMGTDGHRLVLPSSASLNIATSSSAIRWFPAIDSTPGVAVDYAGQVAYINTSGGGNVLDGLFTAYVGSTNYTTRAARIGLQAGHSDGATYTDAYLLIVREAGSGARYGLFVGDHFDIDASLYLKTLSTTPTVPSGEVREYVKGGKRIIAYNDGGTTKYRYMDLTLTANPAVWTYTTTAP